jgi:hypothetical protein
MLRVNEGVREVSLRDRKRNEVREDRYCFDSSHSIHWRTEDCDRPDSRTSCVLSIVFGHAVTATQGCANMGGGGGGE